MPTLNPRVNVTLSPSLDSLVTRLAAAERVSKSMVLRELLEAAEPALSAAVAMMEAAKSASAEARASIVKDMQAAIDAAAGVQHLALASASRAQRDLVDEAEVIRVRRPARVGLGASASAGAPGPARAGSAAAKPRQRRKDPPASNRGVKS